MIRDNLALAGIVAATLVIGTALLFGIEAGARVIAENAQARAFILSDAFVRTFIGIACAGAVMTLGVLAASYFHPENLSGRTGPEEGGD